MEVISVIIPSYNAENFLAEAIESVFSQECGAELELIVVDDGSRDGTARIARSYPSVNYLHQEHSGVAQARNTGLLNCRGQYISFLDADDLWSEGKLKAQVDTLKGDPLIDAVFGHISEFSSQSSRCHRQPCAYAPAYLPGTMLARKSSVDRVGLFDSTLRVGEFVDWYSRAICEGLKTVMLTDVVLRRRLHASNLGLQESEAMVDYATILKAHLARRHKGNQT